VRIRQAKAPADAKTVIAPSLELYFSLTDDRRLNDNMKGIFMGERWEFLKSVHFARLCISSSRPKRLNHSCGPNVNGRRSVLWRPTPKYSGEIGQPCAMHYIACARHSLGSHDEFAPGMTTPSSTLAANEDFGDGDSAEEVQRSACGHCGLEPYRSRVVIIDAKPLRS